ncbi:MAG: TerB family tellurite resistance protein [Hyphomonas sp.]
MNLLKNLFRSKTPAERDMDPHIAVAALLVEAALVDGVYVNIESDMIAEILLEAFDLEADRVDELIAEGETLAEEAVDSYNFTRHVKKLSMSTRISVIEGLYRVALSDGERSDVEDAFIRHVASLLYVDDVARAGARQRAEARRAAES